MSTYSVSVKLTNAVVRNAQSTVVKGKVHSKLYCDTVAPGLMLRVGEGSKTFFVRARINGRDVRRKLGSWGEYTLEEAREEAGELRKTMRKGTDPKEVAKQEQARGITLGEAWQLTKETMASKGRAAKTIGEYGALLDRYLKAWLERPLISITREEVAQRHKHLTREVAAGRYAIKDEDGSRRKRSDRNGAATANAVMRAFRAVWNRALKQHPELPVCPTINVDWHRAQPKRSALAPTQLKTWWDGIEEVGKSNPIRRDLLRLMLLTGLRSESARTIRWEHVDLKRKLLHIPKPKGGEERAFTMPLTNRLVAVLKERQRENKVLVANSPYVFPAASESGHIIEARAEVDGVEFTPHDLRRTFATVAESLSIAPYALKLILNHALPRTDVTADYLRPDPERLRAPMEQIDARLLQLCTKGAKVAKLRRVG